MFAVKQNSILEGVEKGKITRGNLKEMKDRFD